MKAIRPATILAVDDNDAHLYIVDRILKNAGFQVLHAVTGTQTLQLAAQRPDLIILDVNLPDLNGFEICRRLKADPATAKIPVVFLSSTYAASDGKARAQFLGADEFLSHPIQADQLTVIVNGVLARRDPGKKN